MDVKKLDESKTDKRQDSESFAKMMAEKTILAHLIKYKAVHSLHIGERVGLINQLERSSEHEKTIEIQNNLLINKNTIIKEFNLFHETLGFEDSFFSKSFNEKYNPVEEPTVWMQRRSQKELLYMAEKLGITETVELPLK